MRGSKHWDYSSSQRALTLTKELFENGFNKVLNETLGDWCECLSYMSSDWDPNRLAPIIEMFLNEPIKQEEGSFLSSR